MKYPLEKYEYYMHDTKSGAKEIIAVSTYAGKIVKGVAKCDPQDEYSEAKGKKLAAARCNVRVAGKRRARAAKMLKEAEENMIAAKAQYEKMVHYYMDSNSEYHAAVNETNALSADM